MNIPFEHGAVALGCVGKVASWRRPRENPDLFVPMVVVMESGSSDESVYTPASSVTIFGKDQLLALRSAIDEALKEGGAS